MYDVSKLLTKSQFQQLLLLLPTPRQRKSGRRLINKGALLTGILQVLVNGAAWEKIAECGASYVSCWRYLQETQRRGKLKLIFQALVGAKTDLNSCAIDTTTVISFRFSRMVGWDGKHKVNGSKVSLFIDKDGLPVDVLFGKGNKHDGTFVRKHIENTAGRRRKVIHMDMLYSNLSLRRDMRKKGIKINVQTREGYYTRKRGPKFKFDKDNYQTRFQVERTNSWVKAFRSLRIRRSHSPAMFKAFVYLALILVLIRRS